MKKRFLVACIVVGNAFYCMPSAASLTVGEPCPYSGLENWYVYECNCANDGSHWGCYQGKSTLQSNGQDTCYIGTSYGGDDDRGTWICAQNSDGDDDPCGVCKCPTGDNDWKDGGAFDLYKYIYNNTSTWFTCTNYGKEIEEACHAGYYYDTDLAAEGTEPCDMCPSDGGITGTSQFANVFKTDCYLPANSTGRDGSGAYVYTGDCYWSGS